MTDALNTPGVPVPEGAAAGSVEELHLHAARLHLRLVHTPRRRWRERRALKTRYEAAFEAYEAAEAEAQRGQ